VLVVGSDDDDLEAVANLPVERLRLAAGAGKGSAVLAGAALAKEKGYGAILTVDADGQHDPANAGLLLEAARVSWPAIVIGAGRKEVCGMRESSLCSNGFSCFWVRLECGQSLPDTRSGFRLYPVEFLTSRKFIDQERGFEVESLVRGAWAGLPLLSVEMPDRSLPAGDRDIPPRTFRDNLKVVFLHAVLIIRFSPPLATQADGPEEGSTQFLVALFGSDTYFSAFSAVNTHRQRSLPPQAGSASSWGRCRSSRSASLPSFMLIISSI